jgi:hypothetical protein
MMLSNFSRFLNNGKEYSSYKTSVDLIFGFWSIYIYIYSLHHRVQNGSGTHPASYPMGTWGSFPGDKAAEA